MRLRERVVRRCRWKRQALAARTSALAHRRAGKPSDGNGHDATGHTATAGSHSPRSNFWKTRYSTVSCDGVRPRRRNISLDVCEWFICRSSPPGGETQHSQQ
jgi:hypothetical protein